MPVPEARRRSCGALDHGAHLGAAGVHGARLLERRAGVRGGDPRERRLAGPRRPVEDHRVRLAALDRRAQRGAGAEQVLLPDKVAQRLAGACAPRAARPRAGPTCAVARCRRCRTASPTLPVSPMEYALLAVWCFVVALAAVWSASCSATSGCRRCSCWPPRPAAGTGANIGISAVAAATASIAHIRAGRVNWRLFAVDGAALDRRRARRRLPVGSAAGRRAAVRDRRRAALQRHRAAAQAAAEAAHREGHDEQRSTSRPPSSPAR